HVQRDAMGGTVTGWLSVEREPGMTRSLADACATLGGEEKTAIKAVLSACLETTALNPVTAATEDSVTRSLEPAPVDRAGPEPTATQAVLKFHSDDLVLSR
ncbi:hypothetical protein Z043_123364, partial [Scleropages formosus]